MRALGAGKGLRSLRELCLQQTQLDDDAVAILAGMPLLEHVRVLSLRANAITDAGARELASSQHAKNLEAINLYKTKVTAAGRKR